MKNGNVILNNKNTMIIQKSNEDLSKILYQKSKLNQKTLNKYFLKKLLKGYIITD